MPSIRVSDPDRYIADLQAKGIAVTVHAAAVPGPVACPADDGDDPPELVEASAWRTLRGCDLRLPLHTASETNHRDWRARSRRTKAARRAVSEAFGPRLGWVAPVADAYHAGRPVRVALTRLGGRRLDPTNLPAALKAVEDAIAAAMGADDGSPLWRVSHDQEPGGPYGVRVVLEVATDDR